ncbi:hypothetical protein ACIP46_38765 [Streptomyces lavendulae]|uniref:hypothetical protein n=1 Tax=Streptomyces lavendulae TaxID=1914 RepID=UPI0037FE8F6C
MLALERLRRGVDHVSDPIDCPLRPELALSRTGSAPYLVRGTASGFQGTCCISMMQHVPLAEIEDYLGSSVNHVGTTDFTGSPLGLHIAAWDGLNIMDIVASPTSVALAVFDSFTVRRPVVDVPAFGDVYPPGKLRSHCSAVVTLGARQEHHFAEVFVHTSHFLAPMHP